MNISLCIATYCRPERLTVLLDDLVHQEHLPNEVVVVDNDATGSARAVVERRRVLGAPFPIQYDIQPVKNISLTRNRTVTLASGDWIAFIDDDERAPAAWLKQLTETVIRYSADGALGPVVPIVPTDAPSWIRHGRFYEWARMKTGAIIPLNKLRFGNVLLRGALLRDTQTPFDPDYGLTGGEDGDMLGRLVQQGARIVWCDEAVVHEPVEPARLSLRWLLLRALRGGQDFARHRLTGRFGHLTSTGRARLFLRALLQSAIAIGLALLSWPRGQHRAVYWLLKASANLGKMSIFLGWHYREYEGKLT
ncbi:MAG: glycosyltransferase family 2 protein [Sulfuricaulis sp.]